MSSHIMAYAVQDVVKNKELQQLCKTENGVSRSKIMKWIENNKLYATWVEKVLTTLEMKSYQSNLSKALIKAGFTRLGTTGRHVKWLFPPMKTARKVKNGGNRDNSKSEDVEDVDENEEQKDTKDKKVGKSPSKEKYENSVEGDIDGDEQDDDDDDMEVEEES